MQVTCPYCPRMLTIWTLNWHCANDHQRELRLQGYVLLGLGILVLAGTFVAFEFFGTLGNGLIAAYLLAVAFFGEMCLEEGLTEISLVISAITPGLATEEA